VTLARFHGIDHELPLHAVRAARVVRAERPELVLTAGSGSVALFVALSRAAGAKIVFTETMARVTDASASGRHLNRLAHLTVVQWPEMQHVYPGSIVARPALLEGVEQLARAGAGTFVAVGTHVDPFDRLLRLVDEAVDAKVLPRPASAQTGACTYRPAHLASEQWLTPEAMDERIRAAQIVVTHAGSGAIARCLRNGRRPLVLPRRRRFGEHVDDHQLQLSRRLHNAGLIVLLDGAIDPSHRVAAESPLVAPDHASLPAMADVVRDFLGQLEDQR
jgi:UDP-N-acetylglucosamine--N-acetylmuramyl-(pentapeptide) pyrophosphoryl-undecaprenol N-acetylglucosamine transferase